MLANILHSWMLLFTPWFNARPTTKIAAPTSANWLASDLTAVMIRK